MALIDVIKYEGGPDVFAWKYPDDELRLGTQVIVNESQEAVIFKGGQALDILGPGQHTLETKNLPLLGKVVRLPFGGKSPFKAEIWYVNKAHVLNIKWGTPTPIQIQDPEYGVFVPVRAYGQFGIQIVDSRKFLTKLVGTLKDFDTDRLTQYFKGLYITKTKDNISQYIVKKRVSVLHINAYLDEISEYIKGKSETIFNRYGIGLTSFYVNDISVPEGDPAVAKLKSALAKRAEMDIVGYSYGQERSFDTLQKVAENPGGEQSGLMGAGIGMGMGVGLGGAIGGQFGAMTGNFDVNGNSAANQPVMAVGVGVDAGQTAATKNAAYAVVIGRPLNSALMLLEQIGYVQAGSPAARKSPAENVYKFAFATDNGKPIADAADWTVTAISLDEANRILIVDVKHKTAGGKKHAKAE